MKKLAIAAAARDDLRDIKQYTERVWGADQARRHLVALKARFALLRERSRLGRPREELGAGLRSLPSGRHVIFYKDMDDRIEVVRILHASMDVRRHFAASGGAR
jgi:toxin ParE1/3/4